MLHKQRTQVVECFISIRDYILLEKKEVLQYNLTPDTMTGSFR